MIGRITSGQAGFYTLDAGESGVHELVRAPGRFRKEGILPKVGDHVSFTPGKGEENGMMSSIHPRTSDFVRPPVANVTQLAIVLSSTPAPDFLLVDRLLVICHMQHMRALLIYNKCELDLTMQQRVEEEYTNCSSQVLALSALEGIGLRALQDALQNEITGFAGQSGVGKTSLLNLVLGSDMATGGMSRKTERGKHTTRHAQLLALPQGGFVVDTPGFSSLALPEIQEEVLGTYYKEFEPYQDQCRFRPCNHREEPDCAIKQAVDHGEIPHARYARYLLLHEELVCARKSKYK